MPRRAALFRSSISWSEKIWAQVLISCQVSALLIIWGLREAKRVREILIHRVLQPRKSSFPTPDKNSWNHRRQLSYSSWFHRKFQRDNFWQNAITNSSSKVSSNAILANVHKPKILLSSKSRESFNTTCLINFHWNSSFVSLLTLEFQLFWWLFEFLHSIHTARL